MSINLSWMNAATYEKVLDTILNMKIISPKDSYALHLASQIITDHQEKREKKERRAKAILSAMHIVAAALCALSAITGAYLYVVRLSNPPELTAIEHAVRIIPIVFFLITALVWAHNPSPDDEGE